MPDIFPEDLQRFVQFELASGHFRSTRELLVEGIRLLQRDRVEAVEGIQAGRDDIEAGRFQPLDEAFADLRREAEVRILHVRRGTRDTATPEEFGNWSHE